MIYTPRVCDICEEWGCKADEYRQTMQLSTEAVGPEHKAFWPAMRCAFKASNLKATYKARAEAAETAAKRLAELVGEAWNSGNLNGHHYTVEGGWSEDGYEDGDQCPEVAEILEAFNGK